MPWLLVRRLHEENISSEGFFLQVLEIKNNVCQQAAKFRQILVSFSVKSDLVHQIRLQRE